MVNAAFENLLKEIVRYVNSCFDSVSEITLSFFKFFFKDF
jgi:hypothetical protein